MSGVRVQPHTFSTWPGIRYRNAAATQNTTPYARSELASHRGTGPVTGSPPGSFRCGIRAISRIGVRIPYAIVHTQVTTTADVSGLEKLNFDRWMNVAANASAENAIPPASTTRARAHVRPRERESHRITNADR